MFWKIAFVLGIIGIIFGIILIIFTVTVLRSPADDKTMDFALGGLFFGIALLIFSLLLTAVSIIFVLRNSKKEFDAKTAK